MSAFSDVSNFVSSMFVRFDSQFASWRKQAVTGTVPPGPFIADMLNLWSDSIEGLLNTTPALLVNPVPTLFIKLDTTQASAVGYVNVVMITPAADPALPPPPPNTPPLPVKFTATDIIPLTGTGKITANNVIPAWWDFGTLKVTINSVNTSNLSSGGRYQGLIYRDTGLQPQLVAMILAIVP